MKLEICLQSDIFNVFRNTIWDKFEVDCSKYITSCSLSLDLMLKYTKVKIQLFKDITMFDYTDRSILGGLCIASQNITNNDGGSYHHVMLLVYTPILCLKTFQYLIINSFLNLTKTDTNKIEITHVC